MLFSGWIKLGSILYGAVVTTQGHQFILLDLSRCSDISLPAEGEEEEEEEDVVLVVVRVHVDSSGWMGWGNGPCFFFVFFLLLSLLLLLLIF